MTDTVHADAGDFAQIDGAIDALIARRVRDRRNGRGGFDPTLEQAWAASEARHAEQLRRAASWSWAGHHEDLAATFHRLADEHAGKAAALIAALESEAPL